MQEEEAKEQSIGREQSVTQQRILTPQRHSGYQDFPRAEGHASVSDSYHTAYQSFADIAANHGSRV